MGKGQSHTQLKVVTPRRKLAAKSQIYWPGGEPLLIDVVSQFAVHLHCYAGDRSAKQLSAEKC